jgi:hypothetical protein
VIEALIRRGVGAAHSGLEFLRQPIGRAESRDLVFTDREALNMATPDD